MSAEPIPLGRGLDDAAELLRSLRDQQRQNNETQYDDILLWGESFITLTQILRDAAFIVNRQFSRYPQRMHPGNEQLLADVQKAAMTLNSVYSMLGQTNATAQQFVAMARRAI